MKAKTPRENSLFSCAWTWRILSLFSVSCLSLRAAIFTRLRIRCALLSFGWGKWGTSCTLVPFPLSLALRETVIYFVSRESQWLRPKKRSLLSGGAMLIIVTYLPPVQNHICYRLCSHVRTRNIIQYSMNTYPICDSPLYRDRRGAASRPRALACFRRNHRSYMYVWTEALSGMVFVLGQKLSGLVWT